MSLTNIGNFVNNLKLKEYVGDYDVYLFLLKICLSRKLKDILHGH
jgi:hypothetical protein